MKFVAFLAGRAKIGSVKVFADAVAVIEWYSGDDHGYSNVETVIAAWCGSAEVGAILIFPGGAVLVAVDDETVITSLRPTEIVTACQDTASEFLAGQAIDDEEEEEDEETEDEEGDWDDDEEDEDEPPKRRPPKKG